MDDRKGEVSISTLIWLVLGVIVLAISIYLVMGSVGTAKLFTSCTADKCSTTGQSGCPDGFSLGTASCKVGDASGYCCVKTDYG